MITFISNNNAPIIAFQTLAKFPINQVNSARFLLAVVLKLHQFQVNRSLLSLRFVEVSQSLEE